MASIKQVAEAFIAGKPAKCHNAYTDGTRYVLHKTVICQKADGIYRFCWGGFYTPTTASHMNAIIEAGDMEGRVSYAKARDASVEWFTRDAKVAA